ncbi:MAG: hypothetical protein ACOVOR_01960 [Rhabdochlamydiaceae bacterium]
MEDEFNRLLEAFKDGFNGEEKNIHLVMKQSIDTLLKMKESLNSASEEEKSDLIETINHFQDSLREEFKKYTQKEGLNETELSQSLDSRDNFTEEQWNDLQKAKETLISASLKKDSDSQILDPSSKDPKKLPSRPVGKKMLKRSLWIKL